MDTSIKKSRWQVWGAKLILATSMSILSVPAFADGEISADSTLHAVAAPNSTQQQTGYEGIILDADNGEPVIGAAIVVKNDSKITAITDLDGRFKINAPKGSVVSISCLGYVATEFTLSDNNSPTILMKADTQTLDEVVLTAFGVGRKKESVVGAITQIKADELRVPSAKLSNSFAGRLAGVVSFQRSGEPGADGSTFYIRGISTLAGAARHPLIIIDGVEASTEDMNSLDPDIIDGFSILKDATATAMYGTRGANGVIIINTKSGANLEKTAVNVRLEGNIASPTNIPQFADAATYMNMYNEAMNNYGKNALPYTQDYIDGVINGLDPIQYPNIDWYKEVFKNRTFNQKANVNVRGGNKKLDYFVNANISNEEGMLRARSKDFYSYDNNLKVRRYTFQNNINLNLTSTTKLSLNLAAELKDIRRPSVKVNDLFSAIMNSNPVDFPLMYPVESPVGVAKSTNEYEKWGIYRGGNIQSLTNPLAELTKGYVDEFASTVRANLRFNQDLGMITEGLSFGALVSFKNWSKTEVKRDRGYNRYTLSEVEEADGKKTYFIDPLGTEEQRLLSNSSSSSGDRSMYFQATLNYDRTFNKVHNVSAMLLYNQDDYNVNNPGDNLIRSLPKRKMGVAGRFSYDYDHRYLIEVNMGYNGSENFAAGHRFGFFPSIALGYNISQEKWFSPLKSVINNLKLRGSYGLVGNAYFDDAQRFLYLSQIQLQSDSRSFTTGDGEQNRTRKGPVYQRFQNNEITWEVGYKTNLGIDISLFNSLNITAEYFNELRKDIFQKDESIPQYIGALGADIWRNYGVVRNWGFEFAADYGKQITKDFSIQFKGTFSFARNKVIKYAQAFSPEYPGTSIIGHSLETNFGYIYAGHLFIDDEEVANSPRQQISGNVSAGDIKYVDVKNIKGESDGIINEMDKVYMGYPRVPEIIYGFGPSFKYKGFDFSFFFQGVANTSLMMSDFHPFGTSQNRNVLKFITEDYWSSANRNPHAKYPRLTQAEHANNTTASDFWLRDASFLKLKNIELGYTYKYMRVYVNATNVLTFSKFKYWDPEMGGGKGLTYPTLRVINFGVQLSL